MTTAPLIFCAVDTPDLDRALSLARVVSTVTGGVKLGLEFFNAQGPQGVKTVREACPDAPLFLDLKYHDIPNTVAQAVRAAVRLEPTFLNVHAGGGYDMMKAAQDAARDEAAAFGVEPPQMLAVTILTSLDERTLEEVGQGKNLRDQVVRLARLAQKAGLAGVVCSSHEISVLRQECGPDFVLMVPGIRPAGSSADDQKRIMTPAEAIGAGASHLVIGRPITQAANPGEAAKAILASIAP